MCKFEEGWHLMVIDSHTGVFPVENGLSLALLREGGEKVVFMLSEVSLLCLG